MPKCKNCGQEFEGNFCPGCGMKYGEEPLKYAAVGNGGAGTLTKVYSALGFVPAALLALFAVLLFAFFAAPVAVMGGEGASVELGNAYALNGEGLSQIDGLKVALVILIVSAPVGVLCAAAALFATVSRYHRTVGVIRRVTLSQILSFAGGIITYVLALVAGVLLVNKISAFDQGLGLFKAGLCPVLVIAFAAAFVALTVVAVVARCLVGSKHPECKRSDEAYLSLLDEYVKGLSAPEKPGVPEKLMQKMQGMDSEDEIRAKIKSAGKRMLKLAVCVLYMAVGMLAASIVFMTIAKMPTIGNIGSLLLTVACAVLSMGLALLFGVQSRYYMAEVAYARRVKKFNKGKNYTGSKGFNAWLNAG